MNPFLTRHGDTAWTLSGRHTGRTDIPLTRQGEQEARALGEELTTADTGAIERWDTEGGETGVHGRVYRFGDASRRSDRLE
jgi:hypothetical protein